MKAFPTEHPISGTMGLHADGMDLRDYFAAKASEQDIEKWQWRITTNTCHFLAKEQVMTREQAKYAYADAMLEARKHDS